MSVEPNELTGEVWTRWQGHVINGMFPLGRYLGCSDHSGVFLTRSAARPAEVAIKLVPTNRALAEALLPRWRRAGRLAHPHLLNVLEWGGCQLDGLPYLYCVMEYADQTLAQLLLHRALTEDEAREMLLPTLDALAFLHERGLVQGQLKPANILVVGDQLKLASDTIQRVGDGTMSTNAPNVYDAPESPGSSSTAGDIWALGVTLFEALTRRLPSGMSEATEAAELPADFSAEFRDVVAACLTPRPQDRPTVLELVAWASGRAAEPAPTETLPPTVPTPPESSTPEPDPAGTAPPDATFEPPPGAPSAESAPVATLPPAVPTPPESSAPEPDPTAAGPWQVAPDADPSAASTESAPVVILPPPVPTPNPTAAASPPVATEADPGAPSISQLLKSRALLSAVLGSVVSLALAWTAVRVVRTHRTASPPLIEAPSGTTSATPGAAPPAAPVVGPVAVGSIARSVRTGMAMPPSALHQVIPEVPRNARRTIHGHIKVWVRVIVDEDGSVFAAVPDRSGSSRYFRRLAVEAAKQWTFPPVEAPSRRLMQVRFDFSREGTTGRAVALP